MDIELLNTKILFQKNTVSVDAIGNHTNEWTDYYGCHATVSGENGSAKGGEDESAGTLVDHSNIDFTVRWCSKASVITIDGYRVLYGGEIYDIIGVDHMNNKHKCLKFRCRKVRR